MAMVEIRFQHLTDHGSTAAARTSPFATTDISTCRASPRGPTASTSELMIQTTSSWTPSMVRSPRSTTAVRRTRRPRLRSLHPGSSPSIMSLGSKAVVTGRTSASVDPVSMVLSPLAIPTQAAPRSTPSEQTLRMTMVTSFLIHGNYHGMGSTLSTSYPALETLMTTVSLTCRSSLPA